ncbi:PAC2 family protein [Streptomyces zingiberis]|uniref:PAC2 family protein n=1 Tax=Streptomyces zingiberis TaxID=2053010 RepID=A0ABX1BZT1_9ACTN|nr:PAC2 family protein [Streptomyces zingiberis]NJQ01390.1 PAC2 family protein [Streptomyces zingiberis]
MIELEGVPELVDPVMVAAFEGWNDAGDAASGAVLHLDREWKGEVFAALDAEDYYDFQVNRPTIFLENGVRKITWPTTRLSVVRAGGERPRDLVLIRGIEPSMRWRSFCNELLGFAHELGVEMVVILGALLGDTPHTRPVPVSAVTSDPQLARTLSLEESRYEGPTGIVGILQEACTHAGVPAVSLWAAVPHYVSQPPNPKATLALLNRLEDLLGMRIPTGELVEDARAWQVGVDQLASEDSEVAEYVQTLEEARDTAELPEASGEAIAREFERYLRRRDGRPGTAPGDRATESGTPPEGRESGSYLRDPSAGPAGRPPKRPSPGGGTDREPGPDDADADAGADSDADADADADADGDGDGEARASDDAGATGGASGPEGAEDGGRRPGAGGGTGDGPSDGSPPEREGNDRSDDED